jgi:hypothetical protein
LFLELIEFLALPAKNFLSAGRGVTPATGEMVKHYLFTIAIN